MISKHPGAVVIARSIQSGFELLPDPAGTNRRPSTVADIKFILGSVRFPENRQVFGQIRNS